MPPKDTVNRNIQDEVSRYPVEPMKWHFNKQKVCVLKSLQKCHILNTQTRAAALWCHCRVHTVCDPVCSLYRSGCRGLASPRISKECISPYHESHDCTRQSILLLKSTIIAREYYYTLWSVSGSNYALYDISNWGLNGRNWYSHRSGDWRSKAIVLAGSVSPEASPWPADGCFLTMSSHSP